MANDTDKYMYLIPNTIVPYGYELVHILAYPKGFRYRFRFDEEWVEEKVKNKSSDLSGKEAIIVFRDKEKAKFYPVRYAVIESVRKIADIYYIEYILDEIVEYDSKESLRDKQLQNFNSEFVTYHNKLDNNKPGEDMKPLVLLSNFDFHLQLTNKNFSSSDEPDKDSERFGNVIEVIKDINLYEGFEFIKVIDICSTKDNQLVDVSKKSLQLKEDTDYALRILQRIPKATQKDRESPNDIELSSDNRHITVVRGQQRAVGKYDILTFIFRTMPHSGGERSFLDIIHMPKKSEAQHIDPKLYIPVSIKKGYRRLFLYSGAILLSILFYFIPEIIQYVIPNIQKEIIKDVTLITFIISLLDLRSEVSGIFGKRI